MARRRLLPAVAVFGLVIAVGFVPWASEAADEDCSTAAQGWGGCSSGTIAGDHVEVGAEAGSGDAGDGGGSSAAPETAACSGGVTCTLVGTLELPDLAISDLAAFYPAAPGVRSEPNGWTVVGLDTNFVSDAAEHTASGSLLGQTAEVRFTPRSFRWDYGDGIRAVTATGGRTWKALDVPEFGATPTSHVYTAPGSYAVSLAVAYSAQYRIGAGPWHGVAGTLSLPTPAFTIVASDANTVLVGRDCRLDPRGPGC